MDVSTRDRALRTVFWEGGNARSGHIKLIDQPKLPLALEHVTCETVDGACACIRDMVIRGAPAIGAMAGYAMVLAARDCDASASVATRVETLRAAKAKLDASRPTAVNLMWATRRMVELTEATDASEDLAEVILREAEALADEDVAINIAMAKHGAEVVQQGANILHICNTGCLATVDVGTALGVIYESFHQGKDIHAWVCETRPRLQGARLSAWELMREKVPMHLIADSAAGLLMHRGKVDVVLYGADRIAADGWVANKIGSLPVSIVAREHGIPVYVVAPTSTIDLEVATGADIPIEERGAEEVTSLMGGNRTAPEGVQVFNPAFDVVNPKYITGIVTEHGICYPPFTKSLRAVKETAEKAIRARWSSDGAK
ncbi:Methylthioribose-1-phosphate isomerase [Hondaea fermentalgiana]|uniref:Methylthioribose-1-phosphate isomerase n=1 Tax=Hondaea fermentalgiana TaxID=2315210 RepID=A0A2R5G341_9STRA|nr:Methylthioribose-1-phosphate isomerase [Hondaea fermentalgiana]|eukprot:GBG24739.1 Methylthioribose-1-phosphate isomerase [Hondaea fermentalgiana]